MFRTKSASALTGSILALVALLWGAAAMSAYGAPGEKFHTTKGGTRCISYSNVPVSYYRKASWTNVCEYEITIEITRAWGKGEDIQQRTYPKPVPPASLDDEGYLVLGEYSENHTFVNERIVHWRDVIDGINPTDEEPAAAAPAAEAPSVAQVCKMGNPEQEAQYALSACKSQINASVAAYYEYLVQVEGRRNEQQQRNKAEEWIMNTQESSAKTLARRSCSEIESTRSEIASRLKVEGKAILRAQFVATICFMDAILKKRGWSK